MGKGEEGGKGKKRETSERGKGSTLRPKHSPLAYLPRQFRGEKRSQRERERKRYPPLFFSAMLMHKAVRSMSVHAAQLFAPTAVITAVRASTTLPRERMDGCCATASAVEGGKRGPVLLLSRLVDPPMPSRPSYLAPAVHSSHLTSRLPNTNVAILPHGHLRWWWWWSRKMKHCCACPGRSSCLGG